MRVEGKLDTLRTINMLSPAKAAFYSAVLPGLGQIYNRQYWKLPLVYGGIGAGIYFINQNTQEFNKYRTAYFNRKNGLPDDFQAYSDDVLIELQKYYRQQRDTSIMLTILVYFLNIIDANVSAHLKQWNVDNHLSFRPVQYRINGVNSVGLGLNISF